MFCEKTHCIKSKNIQNEIYRKYFYRLIQNKNKILLKLLAELPGFTHIKHVDLPGKIN